MDPIEAMLVEENKQVLRALEKGKRKSKSVVSVEPERRSSSPYLSPRSPTRALLDIAEIDVSRRGSTGYSTSYINHSPRLTQPPYRPLIDTSIATVSKGSKSAATSPVEGDHRSSLSNGTRMRTSSDASNHPSTFGRRPDGNNSTDSVDQVAGNAPSKEGSPVLQKASLHGAGWTKRLVPSAMSEVVRGGDFSYFGNGERGRNLANGNNGKRFSKSRSPAGWGLRSSSPGVSWKLPTENGAERKSSLSRPVKSSLSTRRRADSESSMENERPSGLRHSSLTNEDATASSGDDTPSSDEDSDSFKSLTKVDIINSDIYKELQKKAPLPRDQLEALDQDLDHYHLAKEALELQRRGKKFVHKPSRRRQSNSSNSSDKLRGPPPKLVPYKTSPTTVTLTPAIKVTPEYKRDRQKCRPTTSFDKPHPEKKPKSALLTSSSKREVNEAQLNNPDAQADVIDIGHAQKLPIHRTVITNPHPSRSVRQIYRGDFSKIQKEAKDPDNPHPRRLRKYVVCTDLSPEASHALEWCVGTVLRDGDTLLAVYCVDEEVGIAPSEEVEGEEEIKEQAHAIAQATKPSATPIFAPSSTSTLPTLASLSQLDGSSKSRNNSRAGSRATSPVRAHHRSKAEQERHRAVSSITRRVERLLRKTILQVKVVIEVIHCKNPKHLITEVIDVVVPTLVILGSRGRSALKGVVLGSFSNYLVTKSSVPVMVARKKLHGKKKNKRHEMQHHANNLAAGAGVISMVALAEEAD